jgi:hypothetical protein
MESDDYAQEWLTRLYTAKHCRWCRHPFEPVRTRGLCSNCYRLDQQMKKYYKSYRDVLASSQPPHPLAINRLVNMAAQIHLAKAEGEWYGSIHEKRLSGFDLEREIVFVMSKLIGKRYLEGYATSLARALPLSKRRFAYHLFSLLARGYLRKNRPSLSGQLVHQMIKDRDHPKRLVEEWKNSPER